MFWTPLRVSSLGRLVTCRVPSSFPMASKPSEEMLLSCVTKKLNADCGMRPARVGDLCAGKFAGAQPRGSGSSGIRSRISATPSVYSGAPRSVIPVVCFITGPPDSSAYRNPAVPKIRSKNTPASGQK